MAEFLELLSTIEGESRTTRNVFDGSDGSAVSVNRTSMARRIGTLEYNSRLAEATRLLSDVIRGKKRVSLLAEVMTTDDFPLYFGDILDRTLLARYQEWPASWESYAKRAVVNDFRDAKLIPPAYGADGPLDVVGEDEQYPESTLYEQAPILWQVRKYGRRVPFSWEAIVNDDLGQLQDIPRRLAMAARRTEHRLVANLFVGASGPNTTLYTTARNNIITTANGSVSGNNPVLSINGLQSAYNVISRQVDETGEPIFRDVLTLVVPPALEVTAQNLLNATQIFDSSILGGGQPDNNSTSGERILQVNNWMRNKLRLVVDPYIPIIANTANGHTSWFLFADPYVSREAIRIGFLRGHETPEIFMKSPNAVRVGGGAVSPLSGDFDTDAVEYKVRLVTGATLVDWKATVMSNGSAT